MARLNYVRFARRYWWLLVSVPVLAAALAFLVTQSIQPKYEAAATVVMLNRPASSATPVPDPAVPTAIPSTAANPGLTDLLVDQRLIATYLELVERRPVLEQVMTDLQLQETVEDLARRVSATNPPDTQLIRIRAVDPDAEDAATIANAVAETFIAASELEIGNSGTLALVEPASAASAPFTPNVVMNVGMVFVIAAVGAVSLGLALERFNRSLKTTEDIEDLAGMASLGVVPRTGARGRNNAWLPSSRSDWASAFRQLRSALIADGFGHSYRSLLVTSATAGVGKTVVAANLAIPFALGGFKVLIVDLNLRSPRLHELFGVSNSSGISQYLSGSEPLTVIETAFPNLHIIPAGVLRQHPDDVLAGGLSDEFLRTALSQADVLIVDTPALASSPDAVVLAGSLASSLLVAQAGKTTVDELRKAAEHLASAQALPAGAVLNRAGRSEDAPSPVRILPAVEQEQQPPRRRSLRPGKPREPESSTPA